MIKSNMTDLKEVSNWLFHYDHKIHKWIAYYAKDTELNLDENFRSLKSEDIQDLIIDILELKAKSKKKDE